MRDWQSSWSNLAPRWGGKKFIPDTRFSSLPCEIRDNERRYQRQNSPSPTPSDPTLYFHLLFLFTLFFARWLKHPSHSLFPWLPLQPEKTSWQRNYALYVVSLRLVARFFHSFPFLARRGEGGDRSRRILSTPAAWLCAVKLYQRARN